MKTKRDSTIKLPYKKASTRHAKSTRAGSVSLSDWLGRNHFKWNYSPISNMKPTLIAYVVCFLSNNTAGDILIIFKGSD